MSRNVAAVSCCTKEMFNVSRYAVLETGLNHPGAQTQYNLIGFKCNFSNLTAFYKRSEAHLVTLNKNVQSAYLNR